MTERWSESQLKFPSGYADTSLVMNSDVSAETDTQSETDATQDREILTVIKVAQFLRVPKSTVYKLTRDGELPTSKIRKH